MTTNAREMGILFTKIEMLEKSFDEFKEDIKTLMSNFATKKELDALDSKIKDQSGFISKVMYSLLASALAIIIALVSFIYINGIN